MSLYICQNVKLGAPLPNPLPQPTGNPEAGLYCTRDGKCWRITEDGERVELEGNFDGAG
jgi:hypothetical protein